MQMIAHFKPEVLLLDLHMAEKRISDLHWSNPQLGCVCTLAVSFSNDEEARQLARSYGALALLDPVRLRGLSASRRAPETRRVGMVGGFRFSGAQAAQLPPPLWLQMRAMSPARMPWIF